MKICLDCQNNFDGHPLAKYCSHECGNRFRLKKELNRRKNDLEYRQRRQKKENERKKIKRKTEEKYRLKHNSDEKERYRMKNNIFSDNDLKCSPKGSGCLTKYGYKKISSKGHPNAWKTGEMFEHVYIMSLHLKRPLEKHERVHHKNGIRHDNRIDNLELWSKAHPYGQRVEDKLDWCKNFLDFYGFNVVKRN